MGKIIEIRVGEQAIGYNSDIIKTFGIGSCVVVCLYDKHQKLGGMLHAMLPGKNKNNNKDPRYVENAIDLLLEKLLEKKCRKENIRAKITGGANMLRSIRSRKNCLGDRNVRSAKEKLADLDIVVENEIVGGEVGRMAEFLSKGLLTVRSII